MRFRPLMLRYLTCTCTKQNHFLQTCWLQSYKSSPVPVWPLQGCTADSCSTHPPEPLFSSKLLPMQLALGLCRGMGLFCPRCRILDFPSFNFLEFLPPHFSNLSSSLWIAAVPAKILTAPTNLVLSANLMRVHSPITQVINKNTKSYWPQYWSLRDSSGNQLPAWTLCW